MSARSRKHIGNFDEVRHARETHASVRVLCGISLVPDPADLNKPECANCRRVIDAKGDETVTIWTVYGDVQSWNYEGGAS